MKVWLFQILIASASALAASLAAQAGAPVFPGVLHPNWEKTTVAIFDFSKKGEGRKGPLELELFQHNPSGEITGRELLDLVRPMAYSDFQILAKSGSREVGGAIDDYRDYLGELLNEAIPVLSLNRIIDNEAVKRKLSLEVSDFRVSYVLRAVLAQNALTTGKFKKTDDSTRLSYELLYGWLKDSVGANSVALNIDWNFCEAGLHIACTGVSLDHLAFPPVKLSFSKLPDSWQEFEARVRAQLQPFQTTLVRQTVWQSLVQQKGPAISSAPGTAGEMDRLYDALKDQVFVTKKMHARTMQISISGTSAKKFKDAFNLRIAEQEESSKNDPSLTSEKLTALRESLPLEALKSTLAEFSLDASQGNLKVEESVENLEHASRDELPTDDSIRSQQIRRVFNPLFGAVASFPWFQVVDGDGFRSMFLEEIVIDGTSYLPRSDEQVMSLLRQKIRVKDEFSAFRTVAFKLFQENPIQLQADFCTELPWPCFYPDETRMANALFPEKLFQGQSIGAVSSLSRLSDLDKVLDISSDLFQLAFTLADAKR